MSYGKPLNVKSPDEIKEIILSSHDVKEAIANLARQKAKQYEGHLQPIPAEDKIYGEIHKEALAIIDRIISVYNHRTLMWIAQLMKKTFIQIYEKIIINE